MKCNWCKINLLDDDMVFCGETQKYYCSEKCKEKDIKEYISSIEKKRCLENYLREIKLLPCKLPGYIRFILI